MAVSENMAVHPFRIAHVIETVGPGGAERVLHTNLKHLDRNQFASTVITTFSEGRYWEEPIRNLGASIVGLDCHGRSGLPRAIANLIRLFRREQFDLVHTHLWTANVVGRVAARLAGLPVISSIHCPDYVPEAWGDGGRLARVKRNLTREMDRWTARLACDRMVAVSEYVKASATRYLGYAGERIDVLYNPVDFAELQRATRAEGQCLLEASGIPAGSLIVMHVGHVSRVKGLLYLIEALPRIVAEHPTARLVSVGPSNDQPWYQHLRSEARRLGVEDKIFFLGARRDVSSLLHACDVFAFPSLYEGLGVALVEAMIAGRACVASNVGPIPEVIRHGVDGWLVPVGDPEALGDALATLLGNPARRLELGEAACRSASARFHPDAAAQRLAGIYRSVIASRTSRGEATSERVGEPSRRSDRTAAPSR